MQRRHVVFFLGFIALSALGRSAFAQDEPSEEAIEASRLRGVEYLKSQQGDDGSWFYNSHVVGITSLCGLALLENGVAITDPVIEKSHGFVRRNLDDVRNTYDLALAILYLSRVGDRDNRSSIRDMAARLIAGQNVEGGWSYTNPKVNAIVLSNPAELPAPADGPGDNSCTQFAVLGLWAASRWGVDVNDAMLKVGDRFNDTQMEDGGWAYRHDQEGAASKNTMTFAGLFCLAVARAAKIQEQQEQQQRTVRPLEDPPPPLLEDPVFQHGLEKANAYGPQVASANQARYFLWSVERLGVLLELDQFGNLPWFPKGAASLINAQEEDGSWKNPNEAWGSLADTAFAILFLRRANLGSDISQLLAGEPEMKFTNLTQPDKPTYLTIERAVAAAQPGDVIRVNGQGPFDMPHIITKADLTIEAGPGYTPVFRYDVGYDERGRIIKPEDDPNARHLVRADAGTLTLEGLGFQMNPPRSRGVQWAGIVAGGGNVRMLNCSVIESGDSDMAPVVVAQPGDVHVRNCLFVGGRSGVEVLATGEQSVRMHNSVLFSKKGITVVNGPEGDSRLALELDRSVVQADDVFYFPKLTRPVDITSRGCAYKADYLGTSMLREPAKHEGLTWTGSDNIYDVKRWVGANGALSPQVRNESTWNTFWGGTDEKGTSRLISFLGRLRNGAFTTSVKGEDFEFDSTSAVYSYRRNSGVVALIIGPGHGYTRFRSSFDYREWENADEEAVAAN